MRVDKMDAALFNRAIAIYLQHAYEDETLRGMHSKSFDGTLPVDQVLADFENEDAGLRAYSLRLGCQHYPHLKLAVWEAYYPGEFVFAVDRHDGFDFKKRGPDYDAWVGIRSKNFAIKGAIEDAWYKAGVPTLRSLKEDRLSQSDILRAFGGKRVLVVDNDGDAGAILQMILSSAGYGCDWVPSVKDTVAHLEDDERRAACGMALIDLMLTDGSGLEVLEQLRARPETQDIPIVLTSAMSPTDIDLGEADGYLQKPYCADDLLETVRLTLQQHFDGHSRIVQKNQQEKGESGQS